LLVGIRRETRRVKEGKGVNLEIWRRATISWTQYFAFKEIFHDKDAGTGIEE